MISACTNSHFREDTDGPVGYTLGWTSNDSIPLGGRQYSQRQQLLPWGPNSFCYWGWWARLTQARDGNLGSQQPVLPDGPWCRTHRREFQLRHVRIVSHSLMWLQKYFQSHSASVTECGWLWAILPGNIHTYKFHIFQEVLSWVCLSADPPSLIEIGKTHD